MQPSFYYYGQENTTRLVDKQETVEQLANSDWQQQVAVPCRSVASPHCSKNDSTSITPAMSEEEINYYGCDICSKEKHSYDATSFTHKCPICSITLFCAHLLKEHMREIHGWFTVQRRFPCH